MAEEEQDKLPQPSPDPLPLKFDPNRMIGIIKRKALIKDLAAVYHAQCLSYCQQLLELQSKWDEIERSWREPFHQPFIDITEDSRKEIARPSKRTKKLR